MELSARQKISLALKGNINSLGFKHTEEAKKKISQKKSGKKFSLEHRFKLSQAKLGKPGRKLTELEKENLRKIHLGKKHSVETRKKLSETHIGKNKGENHPNWIKDRTKLSKKDHRGYYGTDSASREWSISIKKRDGWKCKINNKDCNGRLESHHILSWKDYQELRYEINNGITLCHAHHPRKKQVEQELSEYFKELIKQEHAN